MAWTYSGNPASSPRDQVRFLIGDNDPEDPQLTDAEIEFCLTQARASVYSAAAHACEALAGKYARQVTRSIGQVSVQASERAKTYAAMAKDLFRRGGISRALPLVGGISRQEYREHHADRDLIRSPLEVEKPGLNAPEPGCGAEVIATIPLGDKVVG